MWDDGPRAIINKLEHSHRTKTPFNRRHIMRKSSSSSSWSGSNDPHSYPAPYPSPISFIGWLRAFEATHGPRLPIRKPEAKCIYIYIEADRAHSARRTIRSNTHRSDCPPTRIDQKHDATHAASNATCLRRRAPICQSQAIAAASLHSSFYTRTIYVQHTNGRDLIHNIQMIKHSVCLPWLRRRTAVAYTLRLQRTQNKHYFNL